MHMQRKDGTPAKPARALLCMPAKSVQIWRDCNVRHWHGYASSQNCLHSRRLRYFGWCVTVARRVWLVAVVRCPTARWCGRVHMRGGTGCTPPKITRSVILKTLLALPAMSFAKRPRMAVLHKKERSGIGTGTPNLLPIICGCGFTLIFLSDIMQILGYIVTGCSLVVRAPALGAGDRRFKSSHPDAFVAQLDRAAAF